MTFTTLATSRNLRLLLATWANRALALVILAGLHRLCEHCQPLCSIIYPLLCGRIHRSGESLGLALLVMNHGLPQAQPEIVSEGRSRRAGSDASRAVWTPVLGGELVDRPPSDASRRAETGSSVLMETIAERLAEASARQAPAGGAARDAEGQVEVMTPDPVEVPRRETRGLTMRSWLIRLMLPPSCA